MNFILQGSCHAFIHGCMSMIVQMEIFRRINLYIQEHYKAKGFVPLFLRPLSQQIFVLRKEKVGIHIVSRVQRSVYQ